MDNVLDLTVQQKNIWNTEMYFPHTDMYNIGGYILINEKVDFSLLEKAANIYIEKNDEIRAHFVVKDAIPHQYISEYIPFKIKVYDVKDLNEAQLFTEKIVRTPFNIVDSNLFNFSMFRLPNGCGGIVCLFHHLVGDAWSLSIFISEIMGIYSSLTRDDFSYNTNFPSYVDYIKSSDDYFNSNKFNKDKEYWNGVFDTSPDLTYISYNKAASSDVSDISADRAICPIDENLFNEINEFCSSNKVSTYTFFMALFLIYLAKINSTDSAIIGTPVLNRTNVREKNTTGMFVSSVPFRMNIDYSDDFLTFLKEVSLNQLSIFRHQKYPYLHLLNDVKRMYNINENLFDFVLSYQNARDNKASLPVDYTSTWCSVNHIVSSIEAHFYDMDGDHLPEIYYNYQTAKFSKDDILSLHNRILNMAKQAISNVVLKDIEVITPSEKACVDEFNSRNLDYDKSESIIDIFEKNVKKFSDKKAVIFNDNSISYDELDKRSNKVANLLVSNDIKPNDVVGVMFNRSFDIHISILGILKAGASYMLIDPSLPQDRIMFMLNSSKCKVVITDLYLNYEHVSLDDASSFDESLPEVRVSNDDRFCVIYTSGSTGVPKGVELKRLGVRNLINSYIHDLNIDECNNCLSTASVAFDMFLAENFVPLLCGKTVVLANEDEQKIPNFTSKLILKYNVDFIISTPSKISLLLMESNCLRNVKIIQLGGEVFKPSLYNSLKEATNARIYNSYGPSECTCASTNKLVTDIDDVSIGEPCLNVSLYVKNHIGNILPFNYVGELNVCGDNVGIGYMNAMRFNGSYFTGDMAYLSPSLELCYAGRKDNQIKLHGLRIELDEITSRIMKISGVQNAVTVIKKVNDIDCICSYIILDSRAKSFKSIDFTSSDDKKGSLENNLNDVSTDDSSNNLNSIEAFVKDSLKRSLPAYMVPAHIISVSSFPITLNGKIDTKRLPDVSVSSSEFVLPENDTEKEVLDIWKSILGLDKISVTDNFFDLGGDSLASIKLASSIISKFSVNVEMKDIFDNPTVRDLSKLVVSLAESLDENSTSSNHTEINKHDLQEFYPISHIQKGIYYECLLNPVSTSYNTPFCISFDKMPDVKKLEKALNTVINRHSTFRSYFVANDKFSNVPSNEVVQKVAPRVNFKLCILDYKDDNFVKPFDLSEAPLIHAELNIFDNKYQMLIDIHHIICDGSSIGIFMDELCKAYNEESLDDVKYDSIDFILNNSYSQSDEDYFVNKFSNDIPIINMPVENSRSTVKSDEGKSVFDRIDNYNEINSFCRSLQITPYMFFISAFYILLYKYTMQNDIVVGSPIDLRDNADFYKTPGMFVNTLALRQGISSNSRFCDFALSVKKNVLEAFSHEKYPFTELVKHVPNLHRDPSRNPIFDVMFSYESQGLPKLNFDGLSTNISANNLSTSKFDFTLELTPVKNFYNLRLEYSSKLYGKKFIAYLIDCYKNIINLVLNDKEILISDIKMFHSAPHFYNDLKFDLSERVIDLFEKVVSENPDKTCLSFMGEHYTYKELEIKVNKLANHIKNTPIFRNIISKEPVKCIGIMMNRRSEIIISMLAILKCGASYIPIDPTYPDERINYIIEDSRVKMLITEDCFMDRFDIAKLSVDDVQTFDKYSPFDSLGSASDVCYTIYTSGSTGKPKGVMVTNKNVVNFIHSMDNLLPIRNKTIVSVTTMCFDIFVLESLNAICNNMKVIIAGNEEQNNPILLSKICKKNKVSVIQTTPSRFNLLMADENNLDFIKKMSIILLGGEPFPLKLLNRIKAIAPNARIFNMYGPTETTVWSTFKELTDEKDITIGTPINNTSVYVLDNDLNQVPYNVAGKLYIGGLGVSNGYVNRPELTSEKFIKYDSSIIYDTGDIAKFNYDNDLICLGRDDFQVKLHGLRIELGEIESAVLAYPGVQECVVTIKNINDRDIMCAYFVASGRISISLLRSRIAKKLPQYMVPTYLVQLDNFAHTPNGKIDRKNLPEPVIEPKEIVAPKTRLERKLLEVWRKILSIDEISIDDNFFDIGGDSLCALSMQLELMKNNINIQYGDIFKNNTISSLANFIKSSSSSVYKPYKRRDFRLVNRVLRKNNLHRKLNIKCAVPRNVLLVGATGFLGIHVLAELLKYDNIKICCLIRNDPSTSAKNKLKNKFKYYFGSDLSNLFDTRVFVYAGDITKDHFGLSWEEYRTLADETYDVINCAALVKHYGDYSIFEKINVEGLKNIIEFCEEFGKKLYHSSTISVSGNTMMSLPSSFNPDKKILFSEDDLFINQSLDNVYVRSKFEAEKFMLEEIAKKRLKGVILRIGNITNRYVDGKFQENDLENAFLNRLKAFLFLKEIPRSMLNNYIEFSPVDMIAQSIITSIMYTEKNTSVLHLYNSNHLLIADFVSYLNEIGIKVEAIDDDAFKSNLKEILFDSPDSDKVSVLLNDLDSDNNLVYKTNLHITNDFTSKYLSFTDFSWPVITKEYIKKLIENL